jgi:3-hexulose-6-phosphate synthase
LRIISAGPGGVPGGVPGAVAGPRLVELARARGPLLQVALDYTSLADAARTLAAVTRALGDEVFVAEAGTPLVKAEGVGVARVLAAIAAPSPVLVDMKTADTGALEARMAAEAGADATTVLALALDETIEAAASEAHRQGIALVADLIGVRDPVRRAEELASLGVDIVEVHVGIDAQRALGLTAAELRDLVRRVVEVFPGPVAVAGGLNAKTAPAMVEAGASIIVVGGAITRSPSPGEAARAVVEAIRRTRGG